MILDKFMKPKWQHRDPEVRKSAVEEIEEAEILSEFARNDDSPIVRRAAVRKIEDLSLLENIAQQDADSGVRELAAQRFKQLLCGQKEPCSPLEIRVSWVSKTTDVELLEYLLTNAQESELRLAALEKVNREGLLGDVAINDLANNVRLAAIEKITQKSTLERVYKATRNRDKRVSRLARERLDALIEQSERPAKIHAECESICKQIESLTPTGSSVLTLGKDSWERRQTEVNRLQERWQAIAMEAEIEWKTHFSQVYGHFTESLARYQQERESQNQREQALAPIRMTKEDLCVTAEQMNSELQSLQRLGGEEVAAFESRWTALKSQWEQTSPIDDPLEERQWQTRFDRAYQAGQRRYQALKTQHDTTTGLERVCGQAKTLLDSERQVKSGVLKSLEEQWRGIAQPAQSSPLLDELNARFQQTLRELQAKVHAQTEVREQSSQELKQALKELEDALEKGELHTASPLEQRARELWQDIAETAGLRHKTLESRLQKCTVRVNELRSWQRWGDNLEREKLCSQMETLADTATQDNPEETARLIREAQTAWKNLGSSGYSRALWERFNTACNKAYEPCRAYFEAKGHERENNFAQRKSLCERLEKFTATVNWENPNWKEVHRFIREIENAWRNIGPTNRKDKKTVQNRFEKAMAAIQVYLDAEHQRNRQQREDLIVKAEAAQAIEDNIRAIDEVKRLQSQWQVTVPGARREERRLWKRFCSVCDVVFDRRKQQQDEVKQEQQTHLESKIALCEQLEALATVSGEEAKTALGQMRKIQAEWKKVGLIPKKDVPKIEKRLAAACKRVEANHQAQLVAEQRAQLIVLKRKALLCAELEAVSFHLSLGQLEDVAAKVSSVEANWAELPTLEQADLEKKMGHRFEQAKAFLQGQGAYQISEQALKILATSCIRMEILAGVESPPEAMEARMAYQVARLSEAMSGGHFVPTDKTEEIRNLEQQWYLTSPIAGEQGASLEDRFAKAVDAFYRKSNEV